MIDAQTYQHIHIHRSIISFALPVFYALPVFGHCFIDSRFVTQRDCELILPAMQNCHDEGRSVVFVICEEPAATTHIAGLEFPMRRSKSTQA